MSFPGKLLVKDGAEVVLSRLTVKDAVSPSCAVLPRLL